MMLLSRQIRHAVRTLTKLEKQSVTWDFRSFGRTYAAFEEEMSALVDSWRSELAGVKAELEDQRSRLRTSGYREDLERGLREADLPLEGEFPNYELPPFDLVVDLDDEVVSLKFGRRVEKTTALAADAVVEWVAKRYRKVTGRRFNSDRFFKSLLSAYRVANRLTYSRAKGQELWGKPVPLQQLYDLLTLRRESRSDYPRAHFVYDLARLRRAGLTFAPYKLEFGFSRDQGRTFLLRDLETNREDRFSSLAVYREED